MVEKISDSANIDNNVITQIIEYPLKSYMTRIELDDGEYDMAVVSRRDKCGIVAAYEKKQPGFENNGDITMESLITDFTFEMMELFLYRVMIKLLIVILRNIRGRL